MEWLTQQLAGSIHNNGMVSILEMTRGHYQIRYEVFLFANISE